MSPSPWLKLPAEGADGLTEFFTELQVYSTPLQCYDRMQDSHEKSDCGSINARKFGGMPHNETRASMRLLASAVMPELRKLGAEPWFDSESAAAPQFLAA